MVVGGYGSMVVIKFKPKMWLKHLVYIELLYYHL